MPQLKAVNSGLYPTGESPMSPDVGFPGDSSVTSPTKSNDSNVSLKHELKGITSFL